MADCIFCRFVPGKSPVSVVYEDDLVLAFMDIKPINVGHTLIIPKKHAVYLAELDEDTSVRLFTVTKRIAQSVRSCGVRCEGINLFLADGEAAGQEVFHVHMHVIPRFKGDNFVIKCDGRSLATRGELDRIAEQIKSVTPK